MIDETETRFSLEGKCGYETNVILLSHGELDFWHALRTKTHLMFCSTCKQRRAETNAVKGQILTMFPSAGGVLPNSFRLPQRLLRTQIVLAAGFAFVGIVLAITLGGIFENSVGSVKSGTNKTKADVGAKLFPDCEETEKAGAAKKPTKQKVMIKMRTD